MSDGEQPKGRRRPHLGRVAFVLSTWVLLLIVALLPASLVADDKGAGIVNGMSSLAEWQLQRRIERGIEAGAPCTAVAVAGSDRQMEPLIEEKLPDWKTQCQELGAANEMPVVIRVRQRGAQVKIDAKQAREAGFELPVRRLHEAESEALDQMGADHFEAVAWIAVGGVLDDDAASPPWYVATRDRPVISFLRSTTFLWLLVYFVLSLLFAMTPPGFFKGRLWLDGEMPVDAYGIRHDAPIVRFGGPGSPGSSSRGDE